MNPLTPSQTPNPFLDSSPQPLYEYRYEYVFEKRKDQRTESQTEGKIQYFTLATLFNGCTPPVCYASFK